MMARHENYRKLWFGIPQSPDHLHAGNAGHFEIGHDYLKISLPSGREALLGISAGMHLMTGLFEHSFECQSQ